VSASKSVGVSAFEVLLSLGFPPLEEPATMEAIRKVNEKVERADE
jgi:uncharacterized protein (UPF0210 family)